MSGTLADVGKARGTPRGERHIRRTPLTVAPLLRCACPGPGDEGFEHLRVRCRARASQEDRMCDDCRAHCIKRGGLHFITAYGPAEMDAEW